VKIWTGYGSEHSYRLVLIGRFSEERDAELVKEKFDQLRDIASEEVGDLDWGDANPGFSDALYDKLSALKVTNLSRSEVEGFGYLYGLEQTGATVRLDTDDAELQGLLKLLFDHGARVEIYSSHHWTEEGEPRRAEEPSTPGDTSTEADAAASESNADVSGSADADAGDQAGS
jgi:hypothetical protein